MPLENEIAVQREKNRFHDFIFNQKCILEYDECDSCQTVYYLDWKLKVSN